MTEPAETQAQPEAVEPQESYNPSADPEHFWNLGEGETAPAPADGEGEADASEGEGEFDLGSLQAELANERKRREDTQADWHRMKSELDQIKARFESEDKSKAETQEWDALERELSEVDENTFQDAASLQKYILTAAKKISNAAAKSTSKELADKLEQERQARSQYELALQYQGALMQVPDSDRSTYANAIAWIEQAHKQAHGESAVEKYSPAEVLATAHELVLRQRNQNQPEEQPTASSVPGKAPAESRPRPTFVPESPGAGMSSDAVTTVAQARPRTIDDAIDKALAEFQGG